MNRRRESSNMVISSLSPESRCRWVRRLKYCPLEYLDQRNMTQKLANALKNVQLQETLGTVTVLAQNECYYKESAKKTEYSWIKRWCHNSNKNVRTEDKDLPSFESMKVIGKSAFKKL
ncbi:hypothetical protein IHE45_20G036500 [Dioscorea alata]|uniref:Uncharacterized protein n=1 Tax=Dioscorea alata TaxID=55571 RepID=A0ACB7TVX0_DIOAL|nr:hypothetical protein IHE45_20G036500 [Dioscorea alata]